MRWSERKRLAILGFIYVVGDENHNMDSVDAYIPLYYIKE